MNLTDLFSRFSRWTARAAGRPVTFLLALAIILVWGITGPIFHFSDTWQLVINTGTTIITFLMVFLIQNTQYRDSEAIHIKLDELIRAVKGAHNILVNLEEGNEEDLDRIRANYQELARNAMLDTVRGKQDTDSPDIVVVTNNVTNNADVTPEASDKSEQTVHNGKQVQHEERTGSHDIRPDHHQRNRHHRRGHLPGRHRHS